MLTASAALPLIAVAGCRGVGALATPPEPAADVGLLKDAIAREHLMIARYEAVLAAARSQAPATPAAATAAPASAAQSHRVHGLAAALDPLLAEHRAHLAQLQSRLIVPTGAATASPSPPATGAAGPAVPGRPAAAIAFLRTAEQHASDALLSQLGAAPAALAQLLASISASEATHAAILHAGGLAGGQAGGPAR